MLKRLLRFSNRSCVHFNDVKGLRAKPRRKQTEMMVKSWIEARERGRSFRSGNLPKRTTHLRVCRPDASIRHVLGILKF